MLPPHPTLVQLLAERAPALDASASALQPVLALMAAANASASASARASGGPTDAPETAAAAAASLAPKSTRPDERFAALLAGSRACEGGVTANGAAVYGAACAELAEIGLRETHAMQATVAEAEAALGNDGTAESTTEGMPAPEGAPAPRALSAALKVVSGGELQLVDSASGSLRKAFVRVLPSTSELLSDGQKPGTLLGAVPGLNPNALAALARTLTPAQMRCSLRLILKSYELECIAPSEESAREWVRGINHLPLGGKHRHLMMLAKKHAHSPGD